MWFRNGIPVLSGAMKSIWMVLAFGDDRGVGERNRAGDAEGFLEVTTELHEPAGATPLTPDELPRLKTRHISTRGELNELDGDNIIEGLSWLERRSKSFDVLIDDAAREVHKRLFGKVWDRAGAYKQAESNIGVSVWHISTEMRTRLDDARYRRENGTCEPLDATARFHHKPVWIPPLCERKRTMGADHGRCISGHNRSRPFPRLVRRRYIDRRPRPPRAVHRSAAVGRSV